MVLVVERLLWVGPAASDVGGEAGRAGVVLREVVAVDEHAAGS
jgi:hypothetical protein